MTHAPSRILYHHRTQALDGQRVHIHAIQRALRAMGHEVIEVAPFRSTETAGADATRSLLRRIVEKIAALTPAALYEVAELAYNVPAYVRLSRAIRRDRPDCIYERYSLNTVAGVIAARRFGIPLLLEVNSPLVDEKQRHGTLVFHRLARRLERFVLTRADRTLAVTGVLKRMLTHSGVSEHRVRVIQNGVDPDGFSAAAAKRAAVRAELGVGPQVLIGAVGFFREWHGIDQLLGAVAAEVPVRNGSRVLLVGNGPALPALEACARSLGLARRVTFKGAVPHDEVPALVSAMDVVLIPRAVDYASPLKLFEYMAAGKAIVAPRQPNLEEVLTDNVDALFFEPGDEHSLRSALARVVGDPELRTRLGRAARLTIVRRNLTWAGNAARILEVLDEVQRAAPGAGIQRPVDVRPAQLNVLSLTTVFPNRAQPTHGLFVLERLRHLARHAHVHVVAPVSWLRRFGGPPDPDRGQRTTESGQRPPLPVSRPTFFYVPGFLKILDGLCLFLSVALPVRRLRRTFDFDVIDAHFAYPEGVAAACLSMWCGRPFTITMRGTEIPISKSRLRRFAVQWALRRADRVIAVAQPLADFARSLGVSADRLAVVENGVDSDMFRPASREAARRALGLNTPGPVIVSVGHLSARKGFQRVIGVLPALRGRYPAVTFAVVGGPGGEPNNREELVASVRTLGLEQHVIFAGAQPPPRVAQWLNAADVFVLASDYEGCPNVVLEAMACGRPVVATRVGHVDRMVPEYGGVVVEPADDTRLQRALEEALGTDWDSDRIRAYAERQSWQSVAARVMAEWQLACVDRAGRPCPHTLEIGTP